MKKFHCPSTQLRYNNYNEGAGIMGPYAMNDWLSDPKHILFQLARYKFCAKMLSGFDTVIEVGCGDAFAIPILLQEISNLHCVDIEEIVIGGNIKRNECKNKEEGGRISFECKDVTLSPIEGEYDAVISLDVIEHIPQQKEDDFLKNIFSPLKCNGVAIIGTPNITASQYGTVCSQIGHINLKSASGLKVLLLKYFENVFIFSMNDEVIHTGYYPMAHYLMALATGPKLQGE